MGLPNGILPTHGPRLKAPETGEQERGDAVVETHDLSRQRFAALLFGLHRAERSGLLELRQGRRWRKVWFVRGSPVLYESNLDGEGLARTLVQAGLVAARPMAKVVKKLLPDEILQDELVSLGLVDEDDLREHKRQQLERGAAACLAWSTGRWRFTGHDGLSTAIDRALLPDVNPLRSLWTEVRTQLHMEEAVGFVTDPDAGDLVGSDELDRILGLLEVESPLDGLGAVLAEGDLRIDDLFRKVRDKTGHLVHLVWLLESIGIIGRTGRQPDPTLSELAAGDLAEDDEAPAPEPPAAAPEPERPEPIPVIERSDEVSKPPQPAPREAHSGSTPRLSKRALANLPDLLRTARRHRMSKDFYAFLDQSQGATNEQIEVAYRRLVALWRGAAGTRALPESARKDAHDLVQAALTVWRTLSDPERRQEYDRRLDEGRAPSLESVLSVGITERAMSRPGSPIPQPLSTPDGSQPGAPAPRSARKQVSKQVRARRLVDRGEFNMALPLLQQLRLENPSDPDVMADLGWATWRIKSHRSGDDSAEEYLRLALTFNHENIRALEFLARIAKERGQEVEARRHVERLLAVDPDSRWGQAAMKSFSAGDPGQGKGGRRFWKRGG